MAHPLNNLIPCRWLIQRWDQPPREGVSLAWEGEFITAVEPTPSFPDLAVVPGLVNSHVHTDFLQLISAQNLVEWIKHVVSFRRTLGSHPSTPQEITLVKHGTVAWGSIVAPPWKQEPPPWKASRVAFLEVLGDEGAPLPPRGLPISPHSPYSVSPRLLQRVWRERKDSLKAIHLAESREEVAFVRGEENALEREIFPLAGRRPFPRPRARSPVEYLATLECLDEKTLVIHGIFMDHKDVETLAQKGVSVVICPRSNLYLSGELAPLPLLMEAKIPLALGTDGLGSTPSLSLWHEMRALWFYARCRGWNLSPREVLLMATRQGTHILNLDYLTSLEKGKEASFMVIRIPPEIPPEDLATFVLLQGDLHLEALYIKGQRVF